MDYLNLVMSAHNTSLSGSSVFRLSYNQVIIQSSQEQLIG